MKKIILTSIIAVVAIMLSSCSDSAEEKQISQNTQTLNKEKEPCGCQDLKVLVGGMTYNNELVKLEDKKLLPEEIWAMEIMDTYVYTVDCEEMASQGLYSKDSCIVRLCINNKTDYAVKIMKNETPLDSIEKSFKYCKDFKSNLFCYRSR